MEVIDINRENSKYNWKTVSFKEYLAKIIKNVSEIKDLKKSVVMLNDSEQPGIVKDASEIKDLKKSVVMLNDSEEYKSRNEVEQYIRRQQLANAIINLYKYTESLSNNLQKNVDNLINQSNDFIKSISIYYYKKVRDEKHYREGRYTNTLFYLKEANENFIDILKEFKEDITEYNKSIKTKLCNIYDNNKNDSKIRELMECVLSEIVNKFEEHTITFDYILNNKINEEKTLGRINYQDERYGDTINNILKRVNIPSNLSNKPMQDLIKRSNEFVNKMLETNEEIQKQIVKKMVDDDGLEPPTPSV